MKFDDQYGIHMDLSISDKIEEPQQLMKPHINGFSLEIPNNRKDDAGNFRVNTQTVR